MPSDLYVTGTKKKHSINVRIKEVTCCEDNGNNLVPCGEY